MVLYPEEIDLSGIVKLYYGSCDIIEKKKTYFTVQVGDKIIACAEKFSKYPEGVHGYFTLAKSSTKDETVTLPMIKKVIPELEIKRKETSNFHRLKDYLKVSKGKYPMNYENEDLYKYIKEMCDGKECLDNEEIDRLESLQGWIWDYSRLTKEGEKFSSVMETIEGNSGNPETLNEVQKKTLKLMLARLEKGTLSPYFENKVRYYGLNI